jgi:thioredoxin 1
MSVLGWLVLLKMRRLLLGAALNVTDDIFEAEVLKSGTPVLVDFWAPWCGPCKILGPILDQVAAQKGDALKIVKVNIDECQKVASQLGVRGIPALFSSGGSMLLDAAEAAAPKPENRPPLPPQP